MCRFLPTTVFVLTVSLAIPSFAQPANQTDDPATAETEGTFFESVSVEVVDIDVFVTDKKGETIRGLTRDDFELLVDKRPAEISHFSALEQGSRRLNRLEPPPDAATATPPPPTTGETPDATTPPEAAASPLHLIVFIDNVNIRPESRKWVTEQLRRVVPALARAGDAIMLVSYDRRPIVRQPFTKDPQLILAAIDEVEMVTASGAAIELDRRRALEEIDATEQQSNANYAARSYADYLSSELRFTLASLTDFVSSLAGLPGRKALLYVSDGLPLIAGEELFAALDERYKLNSGIQQAFNYDFGRSYERLTTVANSNGVTFYTLDAKGLEVDDTVGAGSKPLVNIRNRVRIDSTRKMNLAAPLKILAEDTGGQAITGTNAVIPALERVIEDFTTYYSVGYTPASADGRFHDITVRVKGRPDLTVRHRDGFRLKDPQSRLMDVTGAALDFGITRDKLGVEVTMKQPTSRGEGLWLLPIDLRIPLGELTMLPTTDGQRWFARIQVAVGTLAPNGEKAPVQVQPSHLIEIPVADLARAKASYYTYELQLVVRGGTQRISIGVRDEIGGFLETKAEIVTIRG